METSWSHVGRGDGRGGSNDIRFDVMMSGRGHVVGGVHGGSGRDTYTYTCTSEWGCVREVRVSEEMNRRGSKNNCVSTDPERANLRSSLQEYEIWSRVDSDEVFR